MNKYEMSWCQDCKRWVPSDRMNYFDGKRICNWCLGGLESPEDLVADPLHESTQCIYCDSFNTKECVPSWGEYKCLDCGEIFRRF